VQVQKLHKIDLVDYNVILLYVFIFCTFFFAQFEKRGGEEKIKKFKKKLKNEYF